MFSPIKNVFLLFYLFFCKKKFVFITCSFLLKNCRKVDFESDVSFNISVKVSSNEFEKYLYE